MGEATVFVSYRHCRRDAAILERIKAFLDPVQREGLICAWTDQEIAPGQRWRPEIEAALERAGIGLLLISQDFLASHFIHEVELPRLFAREAQGATTLLPLFVSPFDEAHEIEFLDDKGVSQRVRPADLEGIARPDRTLIDMKPAGREQAFKTLVERIRQLAKEVLASAPLPPLPAPWPSASSPSDRHALTLWLAHSASRCTVQYRLQGPAIPPLVRPWAEVRPLVQAATGGGSTQSATAEGALFTLLFGAEVSWDPLFLQRRAGAPDGGEALLLAGLRRWLGGGEEPVTAFHQAVGTSEPVAQPYDPSTFVVHANYRTWQTSSHRRWRVDPLPHLALDRDRQKALVTRHLNERVRSPHVRLLALIAYGSKENLLSELTEQLAYALDLTAADWAAIERYRVTLPDDRSALRDRLEAHLNEVLGVTEDESSTQLLRRKGPRGMRPGVKGVVWLDWGVLDGSEPARAWPSDAEVDGGLTMRPSTHPTQL